MNYISGFDTNEEKENTSPYFVNLYGNILKRPFTGQHAKDMI